MKIRYIEIFDSIDSDKLNEIRFERCGNNEGNEKMFRTSLGGMYRTFYIKPIHSDYIKRKEKDE